jgi:hypothetical protein
MMTNFLLQRKYDIFLSYSNDGETYGISLYETLRQLYNLNVWIDIENKKTKDKQQLRLNNGLINSKVYVACVTKIFIETNRLVEEINFALQHRKHVLLLLYEEVYLNDYALLTPILSKVLKIDFYKEQETIFKCKGILFNKFIDTLELMIFKKINRTQTISISGENISSACKFHIKPSTASDNNKHRQVKLFGFKQVRVNKRININFKQITCMIHLKIKNRILICDCEAGSLMVTDQNGRFLKKLEIQEIKKPFNGVVNKKCEIIISDLDSKRLKILDFNLKFNRELPNFTLNTNKFEMTIDYDSNNLIISDFDNDRVLVIDGNTGDILNSIHIKKPTHLKHAQNRLFVISELKYILILNSLNNNYKLIQTIKNDKWTNLKGIHLDSRMNLYTSACEHLFPLAFMYAIDSLSGNILNKIYIHLNDIQDFIFVDRKYFFNCFNTQNNNNNSTLSFIEFE